MDYVIGVDIGGTQTRAALIDQTGHILAKIQEPTVTQRAPDPVIQQVLAYIAHMQSFLPPDGNLLGIGVGSPGPLNPDTGIIFSTPNMHNWHEVPLRDILSTKTGLVVKIANDANAAAIGEWHFGGGVGHNNLVYITVSTGIGSGVITDGKLLLGRLGAGGELGHMIVEPRDLLSWEYVASGTGLARRAAAAMPDHPASLLHQSTTAKRVTAADVARAAEAGDELAQQLMHQEATYLGIGFVNILHVFSPEIILVGGSVVTSNPWLLDEAQNVVQSRVIDDLYRSVPIEVAHLGEQVGLLGAAALLLVEQSEQYSQVGQTGH